MTGLWTNPRLTQYNFAASVQIRINQQHCEHSTKPTTLFDPVTIFPRRHSQHCHCRRQSPIRSDYSNHRERPSSGLDVPQFTLCELNTNCPFHQRSTILNPDIQWLPERQFRPVRTGNWCTREFHCHNIWRFPSPSTWEDG